MSVRMRYRFAQMRGRLTDRDLDCFSFTVFEMPRFSDFDSSGGGGGGSSSRDWEGEDGRLTDALDTLRSTAEKKEMKLAQSDLIHRNFISSPALGRLFSSLMKHAIRNSLSG